MIEYFSFPERLAAVASKGIKEAQDFLVTGKTEDIKESGFILDATPDPELDENPGKISGDCTAGKPLPFDDPDLMLYNTKVFEIDTREHIGNMYVLVTTDEKSGCTVWHFEAIQIPKSRVVWKEAIGSIIQALAPEAIKQGVGLITVNNNVHAISNYDYIGEGAEAYWKEIGPKITTIDIPRSVEEEFEEDEFEEDDEEYEFEEDDEEVWGHSRFQSDGIVKILWRNPNLDFK